MEMILIRGLPGTGKSTIAKEQYPDHVHLEADMFFERDGEYKFDSFKLRDAHRWCRESAREALEQGESVVVANTFVQVREAQPYMDMAEEFGAILKIVVADGDFKNIHEVPKSVTENMKERWEEF